MFDCNEIGYIGKPNEPVSIINNMKIQNGNHL